MPLPPSLLRTLGSCQLVPPCEPGWVVPAGEPEAEGVAPCLGLAELLQRLAQAGLPALAVRLQAEDWAGDGAWLPASSADRARAVRLARKLKRYAVLELRADGERRVVFTGRGAREG